MSEPGAVRRTLSRIWRRLRGERRSRARVALAVAIGLFIGCLPVYGLHFVLCLAICLPLDLDLVLAYLVANISNPFVAPFLITLEIEVGSLVLTGEHAAFTLARARQTGILGFALQAGVGSVFVGATLAALGAGIAYAVSSKRLSHTEPEDTESELEAAVLRTIQRYAPTRTADRYHVAGKLRWDPLTKLLGALPRDLGRVLDAGAGRGQFGLLLLELQACQTLFGFDSDPNKVRAAQAAAQPTSANAPHFEVRDLLALPSGPFDTVLLFDVLHYLPIPEQDQLLSLASTRVPHGRILIRDLDATHGARSLFTRSGEWLAQTVGLHRGRAARHYRPASELVARLAALGFTCEVQRASEGTPFANVLIVAKRA